MLKNHVAIKTTLIKSTLIAVLTLTSSLSAFAAPPQRAGQAPVEQGPKNECDPKDLDVPALIKGLVLASQTQYKIKEIIAHEKAKGNDAKVLIIARAGQDLSGAMVLKDTDNQGRLIGVRDIMNEVIGANHVVGEAYGEGRQTGVIQNEIKRKFQDKGRSLRYSHMGILILDHSIKRIPHKPHDEKARKIETDYIVDELLKPCEDLIPRSWWTGLPGFFQDDPHEYQTILMVPSQDVQEEILKILDEKEEQRAVIIREGRPNFELFLGKKYNAAAAYTDLVEQNSNSYVLEVIAAAHMKVKTDKLNSETTRGDILNYLKSTGYRPTKIIADSFKMSFATSVFAPNSLQIHDKDNPYARPYVVAEFVTELSVREWMQRTGILDQSGIYTTMVTDAEVKSTTEVRQITDQQAARLKAAAKEVSELKRKKKAAEGN